MQNKKRLYSIFSVAVASLFIAGCQVRTTMNRSELNKAFKTDTAVLVDSKKVEMATKKSNNKIKVTDENLEQLRKDQAKVMKIQDKLDNSKIVSSYPKDVSEYNQSVYKYTTMLRKGSTQKALNSQFHKTAVQGTKVVKKHQDGKFGQTFKEVLAADNLDGYKLTSSEYKKAGLVLKKSKKPSSTSTSQKSAKLLPKDNKQDKAKHNQAIKAYQHKRSVRVLEGLSFVSAIMIIVFIFLQPSKQDDSMNALADNGGSTLFNRPKPQGYALFLIRSTEFFILTMVGSLIALDFLSK